MLDYVFNHITTYDLKARWVNFFLTDRTRYKCIPLLIFSKCFILINITVDQESVAKGLERKMSHRLSLNED